MQISVKRIYPVRPCTKLSVKALSRISSIFILEIHEHCLVLFCCYCFFTLTDKHSLVLIILLTFNLSSHLLSCQAITRILNSITIYTAVTFPHIQ